MQALTGATTTVWIFCIFHFPYLRTISHDSQRCPLILSIDVMSKSLDKRITSQGNGFSTAAYTVKCHLTELSDFFWQSSQIFWRYAIEIFDSYPELLNGRILISKISWYSSTFFIQDASVYNYSVYYIHRLEVCPGIILYWLCSIRELLFYRIFIV